MSTTVLYGLDQQGGVRMSERLSETSLNALTALAQGRLSQFHKVEVWVQSICVVRLRRGA
ncbi:hypothetical protein [Phenylobacterium deserti]|nr:hypothetical protein [Phenylobacterium deserti]